MLVDSRGNENAVGVLSLFSNKSISTIEKFPEEIRHLSIVNNDIRSISHNATLKNLLSLSLPSNKISSIRLLNSANTLVYLNLASNFLTSLSNMPVLRQLEYLDVSFNCISEFSLPDGFVNLRTIILDSNQLESPPKISNLPLLENLSCNHQSIGSSDWLSSSIVSEGPSLKVISYSNNKLPSTALDFTELGFTSLGPLHSLLAAELDGNRFGDSVLSRLSQSSPRISYLSLRFCGLGSSDAVPVALQTIPSFLHLRVLRLDGNRMASLDALLDAPHLCVLSARDCGLKSLFSRPDAAPAALCELDVSLNSLESSSLVSLSGLVSLLVLRISGNPFQSVGEVATVLQSCRLNSLRALELSCSASDLDMPPLSVSSMRTSANNRQGIFFTVTAEEAQRQSGLGLPLRTPLIPLGRGDGRIAPLMPVTSVKPVLRSDKNSQEYLSLASVDGVFDRLLLEVEEFTKRASVIHSRTSNSDVDPVGQLLTAVPTLLLLNGHCVKSRGYREDSAPSLLNMNISTRIDDYEHQSYTGVAKEPLSSTTNPFPQVEPSAASNISSNLEESTDDHSETPLLNITSVSSVVPGGDLLQDIEASEQVATTPDAPLKSLATLDSLLHFQQLSSLQRASNSFVKSSLTELQPSVSQEAQKKLVSIQVFSPGVKTHIPPFHNEDGVLNAETSKVDALEDSTHIPVVEGEETIITINIRSPSRAASNTATVSLTSLEAKEARDKDTEKNAHASRRTVSLVHKLSDELVGETKGSFDLESQKGGFLPHNSHIQASPERLGNHPDPSYVEVSNRFVNVTNNRIKHPERSQESVVNNIFNPGMPVGLDVQVATGPTALIRDKDATRRGVGGSIQTQAPLRALQSMVSLTQVEKRNHQAGLDTAPLPILHSMPSTINSVARGPSSLNQSPPRRDRKGSSHENSPRDVAGSRDLRHFSESVKREREKNKEAAVSEAVRLAIHAAAAGTTSRSRSSGASSKGRESSPLSRSKSAFNSSFRSSSRRKSLSVSFADPPLGKSPERNSFSRPSSINRSDRTPFHALEHNLTTFIGPNSSFGSSKSNEREQIYAETTGPADSRLQTPPRKVPKLKPNRTVSDSSTIDGEPDSSDDRNDSIVYSPSKSTASRRDRFSEPVCRATVDSTFDTQILEESYVTTKSPFGAKKGTITVSSAQKSLREYNILSDHLEEIRLQEEGPRKPSPLHRHSPRRINEALEVFTRPVPLSPSKSPRYRHIPEQEYHISSVKVTTVDAITSSDTFEERRDTSLALSTPLDTEKVSDSLNILSTALNQINASTTSNNALEASTLAANEPISKQLDLMLVNVSVGSDDSLERTSRTESGTTVPLDTKLTDSSPSKDLRGLQSLEIPVTVRQQKGESTIAYFSQLLKTLSKRQDDKASDKASVSLKPLEKENGASTTFSQENALHDVSSVHGHQGGSGESSVVMGHEDDSDSLVDYFDTMSASFLGTVGSLSSKTEKEGSSIARQSQMERISSAANTSNTASVPTEVKIHTNSLPSAPGNDLKSPTGLNGSKYSDLRRGAAGSSTSNSSTLALLASMISPTVLATALTAAANATQRVTSQSIPSPSVNLSRNSSHSAGGVLRSPGVDNFVKINKGGLPSHSIGSPVLTTAQPAARDARILHSTSRPTTIPASHLDGLMSRYSVERRKDLSRSINQSCLGGSSTHRTVDCETVKSVKNMSMAAPQSKEETDNTLKKDELSIDRYLEEMKAMRETVLESSPSRTREVDSSNSRDRKMSEATREPSGDRVSKHSASRRASSESKQSSAQNSFNNSSRRISRMESDNRNTIQSSRRSHTQSRSISQTRRPYSVEESSSQHSSPFSNSSPRSYLSSSRSSTSDSFDHSSRFYHLEKQRGYSRGQNRQDHHSNILDVVNHSSVTKENGSLIESLNSTRNTHSTIIMPTLTHSNPSTSVHITSRRADSNSSGRGDEQNSQFKKTGGAGGDGTVRIFESALDKSFHSFEGTYYHIISKPHA